MCCVCESSGISYSRVYWFPNQWNIAVKRAIGEGKIAGKKFKVYKAVFAGGKWGWKISPVAS